MQAQSRRNEQVSGEAWKMREESLREDLERMDQRYREDQRLLMEQMGQVQRELNRRR